MPLLQSINAKRFRTFGEMALDFVKKKNRSLVFSLHPLSSISLIDMTFKTLSKRQNGTVDPSPFSLHLIEGRVIPDLLVLVKILLDFSAITLPNIFVRTVLSKKGNHFTWPVYFLILKQLKC